MAIEADVDPIGRGPGLDHETFIEYKSRNASGREGYTIIEREYIKHQYRWNADAYLNSLGKNKHDDLQTPQSFGITAMTLPRGRNTPYKVEIGEQTQI